MELRALYKYGNSRRHYLSVIKTSNTYRLLFLSLILSLSCRAQEKTDTWLMDLLKDKGDSLIRAVLAQPDTFRYQIIYTRIDRSRDNQPRFTDYFVHVDRDSYFNPASTVKLPTALAALEKMNRLKGKGIDKYTAMLTDSAFSGQSTVLSDTSAENGMPSVAQYIRKIFLVSDNDAYNRLYEFVGQQELNETLHKKGYKDVRITRRFVPMNEEENRHTNPIRFVANGQLLYRQPEAYSRFVFDYSKKTEIGRGHWDQHDSLINEPMDFTTHNNLPLEDLHRMLRSALFPGSVAARQRFNLSADDQQLLRQYMSAYPGSSRFPAYDTLEYFDSYAKFFFKAGRGRIPASVRIYNKPGWSYGFLTDAAYVTDTARGIEFMLSAVIYVNSDGILNDNRYEYEQIGYPFFHELYRVIYEYEEGRRKR